jgi:hypothetical protein
VVQTAFIGVADIHSRPLPDRFKPFEFIDLRGVVLLGFENASREISLCFICGGSAFGLEHKERSK